MLYKCYLDNYKLKWLTNKKEFIINGWAFSSDKSEYELETYINGKKVDHDLTKIVRSDLMNKYPSIVSNPMCGFRIVIHCEQFNSINRFDLYAVSKKGKQKLKTLNRDKIVKNTNKTTIDYSIDLYNKNENNRNVNIVGGWAISLNDDDLSYKIVDSKNREISYHMTQIKRPDLLDLKIIDHSQDNVGFTIEFPSQQKEKYSLIISNSKDTIKYNLEKVYVSDAKRKLIKLKSYIKAINKDNVLKSIRYIRIYGLKKFLKRLKRGPKYESIPYQQWFEMHKVTHSQLKEQRKARFDYQPLISVVVPTYNTPKQLLIEMIESIVNQSYTHWELCIADGNSKNQDTIDVLNEYSQQDSRIKVQFLEDNYMISGNTNKALEMVTGDFVALMDHDDLLEPNALFEYVKLLNEDKELDFIYSDEDKISEDSKTYSYPHFKPDFAIDNLRCYNYITHFSVIRKSILDEVGPFDSKCDGAQDYDMFLRIVDTTRRIAHIPQILYHWRITGNSTAQSASNKKYVLDAGKRALKNHLERNGIKGTVTDGLAPTIYRVDYEIIGNPLVSIVICTKDHIDDLDQCIQSILTKTLYKNYEIIIVENNSEEEKTFQYYESLKQYSNIKVIYWKDEFNYSAINNFGVQHANGEYVLLLNNDIEVINPEWLTEMLMLAQRKDVGAVGAKLLYPDNTIQHAGVIIGIGGIAGHSHKYFDVDDPGYVSRLIIVQDVSAVTAACLLIKKSIFEEVGGLTESFKVAFNDVDFCLKVRKAGYLNVFTPYAKLYHHESKSRGLEDTYEKKKRFLGEQLRFKEKWPDILEKGDPFYNPNLSLTREDFSIRE